MALINACYGGVVAKVSVKINLLLITGFPMAALALRMVIVTAWLIINSSAAAGTGDSVDAPETDNEIPAVSSPPRYFPMVHTEKGLSMHKDIYALPVTWSEDYHGDDTEIVFQISAKIQLWKTDVYFAFTQKSFWQAYDRQVSSPFRESNYNPELFYRWKQRRGSLPGWGVDAGLEHESNGRRLPDSRSWNRIYVAPFYLRDRDMVYVKLWYRIPERDKKSPRDAEGDDNPDITDFLGYTELHYRRWIGADQRLNVMITGNPATGRGAVNLSYDIPSWTEGLYYRINIWNGFGESLIDYDNSITRFGVGFVFLR